jgi:protoheme IX farnesyltransferase
VFKTYYHLTKPGIIYGNLLTTAAGFFLASKYGISFLTFFAVMLGTACIIASACVCNNYMDREIDAKMERTKKRALVIGKISVKNAFVFAGILTNLLTLFIGLIGFVDYVFLYGISKRRSIHGTLVGGISGAAPIVAGYTAVTNSVDVGTLLLFLILMFWQMPHFYAIAIYRIKDYASASIPVFPVKKGIALTKVHMFLYLLGFIISTLLLPLSGLTGYVYLFVMIILNGYWLWKGIEGFGKLNDALWARKMFSISLLCLTVFSLLLIGTPILP